MLSIQESLWAHLKQITAVGLVVLAGAAPHAHAQVRNGEVSVQGSGKITIGEGGAFDAKSAGATIAGAFVYGLVGRKPEDRKTEKEYEVNGEDADAEEEEPNLDRITRKLRTLASETRNMWGVRQKRPTALKKVRNAMKTLARDELKARAADDAFLLEVKNDPPGPAPPVGPDPSDVGPLELPGGVEPLILSAEARAAQIMKRQSPKKQSVTLERRTKAVQKKQTGALKLIRGEAVAFAFNRDPFDVTWEGDPPAIGLELGEDIELAADAAEVGSFQLGTWAADIRYLHDFDPQGDSQQQEESALQLVDINITVTSVYGESPELWVFAAVRGEPNESLADRILDSFELVDGVFGLSEPMQIILGMPGSPSTTRLFTFDEGYTMAAVPEPAGAVLLLALLPCLGLVRKRCSCSLRGTSV